MMLSIVRNNSKRLFFLLNVFLFILNSIILFHQQSIQTCVNTSDSHLTTRQNDIGNNDYTPRLHQPLTSLILRGLLVFYPQSQEEEYLPELLWFYRSWLEMMQQEPFIWRTDLIIYTEKYTLPLQQLGCIYNRIRINKGELPQCRVFPYQTLDFRNGTDEIDKTNMYLYQQFDKNRSMSLMEYTKKYPYIDSINIIAECYPSFAMYDYILRTDIDVFLTKNFGHFVPHKDALLVGKGGYSTAFSARRLTRIAKDMNWMHANITNIGSTWYGPPHIAQRIANFSLEAVLHLSMNEFTLPERQGRLGDVLWPEWHFGVLSMYGTHLAVNHLIVAENIRIGLATTLLDQNTDTKDLYDIEKNNHLHLHCWHTFEPFSKSLFKDGRYNHINPSTLMNDTSASGYAMRLALESRLMSFGGLRQALLTSKSLPNS
ncbi:unnamed protein product [Adineta steineri]|uniref:DUF7164 domain-containing protein n=1 Tax=Adineta steineri TaxID=433720 RepID=A0A814MEP9_9BILA|nr:unnamed protein product [Adineta steineri]